MESRSSKRSLAVAVALASAVAAVLPAFADDPSSQPTSWPSPQYGSNGGYTALDSNDVSGPAYNFVDISETGTKVTLGDDEATKVDLPFTYGFFDRSYDSLFIDANGVLSLSGELPADGSGEQYLPDYQSPNGLIAGYWTDLDPSAGGTIAYQSDGEVGSRTFTVMYKDVPHWRRVSADPGPQVLSTFEIILHEGSTKSVVQISHAGVDQPTFRVDPSDWVIGVESETGGQGVTYRYDDADIDQTAVAFERTEAPLPPPPAPAPPIVTTYADFSEAGASHFTRDGDLPDRSATASSTADLASKTVTLDAGAKSLVTSAGTYTASGSGSGYVRVPHTFASTTTYATVTIRLKIDQLAMKVSAVGGSGTSAALRAGIDGSDMYCWSPYYEPRYYGVVSYSYFESGCTHDVAFAQAGWAGESGFYYTSPKTESITFDVDPYGTSGFNIAIEGIASADDVRASSSVSSKVEILDVTIIENSAQGTCDYYGSSYCVVYASKSTS